MFSWGQDIGIDLGTATVIAYVKGKGIVLREPSVVAVDSNTNEVLAVGKDARRMQYFCQQLVFSHSEPILLALVVPLVHFLHR